MLIENLIDAKDIELDFTTKDALKKVKDKSFKDTQQFREDIRLCIATIIDKIM